MFPPVPRNSILFASLACGHTNAGLRAIVCQCLAESLLLGNGKRFDMDKVRKRDPAYAEAAGKGLFWTVIPQCVIDAFPDFVGLFDASRNAKGHVQTPESEVSGMNKLFAEWAKLKQEGSVEDYLEIVASVVRPRPIWGESVEHMVAFLGRHSGGTKAKLWNKFKSIHIHFVPRGHRMILDV